MYWRRCKLPCVQAPSVISKLDSRDGGGGEKRRFFPQPLCTWLYLKLVKRKELRGTELAYGLIENKFKWCIGKSSFNIPTPPLPPGHTSGIWHLCHPGEDGIWLSESSRGWGIWSPCFRGGEFELHPWFHVKSLASWAIIEDGVLEDSHGKDFFLCGQLVTRKGLNKLCAIFEGIWM